MKIKRRCDLVINTTDLKKKKILLTEVKKS